MLTNDGNNEKPRAARGWRDYLGLVGVGAAMGAADVVPGVSGGTMAFVLGVYEELLGAIRAFDFRLVGLLARFRFRAAWAHVNGSFLLALGAGLGGTLLSLAHAISWLLDHHPVPLFAFFFGLVLASIVSVSRHVRWNLGLAGAAGAGTAIAYGLVRLTPMQMPHDPLTLFGCAAVAIMAMILPGISGSFILFILGQYKFILDAVKRLDVVTLLPVLAGMAVGLMAFSRVLTWLLRKYHQATIASLTGFMIGSLWKIWPFREVLETMLKPDGRLVPVRDTPVWPEFRAGLFWLSLALGVAGFLAILALDHLAERNRAAGPAGEADGEPGI